MQSRVIDCKWKRLVVGVIVLLNVEVVEEISHVEKVDENVTDEESREQAPPSDTGTSLTHSLCTYRCGGR